MGFASLLEAIKEFFTTLSAHRRIIRELKAENLLLQIEIDALSLPPAPAVQPDSEPEEAETGKFFIRRRSWQDIASAYEIEHNRALKAKIQAEKQRREAFDR